MSDEEKVKDEAKKPVKKTATKKEEKKDAPAPKPKEKEKTVVRMTVSFRTYAVKGETFNRKEPFKVLDVDVAEAIIAEHPDHFRLATRKEVEDFYGPR